MAAFDVLVYKNALFLSYLVIDVKSIHQAVEHIRCFEVDPVYETYLVSKTDIEYRKEDGYLIYSDLENNEDYNENDFTEVLFKEVVDISLI